MGADASLKYSNRHAGRETRMAVSRSRQSPQGLKWRGVVPPVADAGFVVVASNASGIKSWADLVKKAKAKPDELTFASAGLGNSTHLCTEMIGLRSSGTYQVSFQRCRVPSLHGVREAQASRRHAAC